MTFLFGPKLTKEGSNSVQIFAIFSLGLACCAAGTMFAWTSPTIPKITSEDYPDKVSLEQASYLTVIPPLASLLGGPFFAAIMDIIGRKKSLLLVAVPHIAAWLIIMFSDSIHWWYFSRFLYGFADGCLFTAMPTYMGEITTPAVRGSWGNLLTLSIYFGQLFVNTIGGYCSVKTTAYVFVTLPILFVVCFHSMPESPYYLIMRSNFDGARESLKVLRRRNNVEEEFSQLMRDVQRQQSETGTWRDLFGNPTHRKALVAGAFIRGAQQFSGMAAFATYTAFFFQEAGAGLSNTVSSIVFCLILVVMNIISSVTLDKLGRRCAMVISCAGCSTILTLMGVFFYLRDFTDLDLTPIVWFPVLAMFLNLVTYSLGVGIVPTLIIGELFSTSIKAKGVCALQIVFALYAATTTKLFQLFVEGFGMFSPFLFFGLCTVFSSVLSYYIVPETKGKTLEEIQQDLKN